MQEAGEYLCLFCHFSSFKAPTLERGRALSLMLMGGPSRPCPLELPAQVLSLSLFSYCTTGVITPTCKG